MFVVRILSRGGAAVHGAVSHVALCAHRTMTHQIPVAAGCCGSAMCTVDPCRRRVPGCTMSHLQSLLIARCKQGAWHSDAFSVFTLFPTAAVCALIT